MLIRVRCIGCSPAGCLPKASVQWGDMSRKAVKSTSPHLRSVDYLQALQNLYTLSQYVSGETKVKSLQGMREKEWERGQCWMFDL